MSISLSRLFGWGRLTPVVLDDGGKFYYKYEQEVVRSTSAWTRLIDFNQDRYYYSITVLDTVVPVGGFQFYREQLPANNKSWQWANFPLTCSRLDTYILPVFSLFVNDGAGGIDYLVEEVTRVKG